MKEKYQTLVNQTIPISKAMNWTIEHISTQQIECKVSLQPNINIHGTAFAGSIYATALASGWTLLKYWSDSHHLTHMLVAAEANIQYKQPINADFFCHASINTHGDAYKKLVERVNANRSCAFLLEVEIKCDAQTCAILNIQFVFKSH